MKMKKWLLTALVLCMVLVLPVNAHAAEEYSGTCGENLTWTLDADGLLVISGEGEMDDFTMKSDTVAPWNYYLVSTSVKRVVIEPGVTSIGDYAFCQGRGNQEEIVIPDTVTSIGTMAFGYCEFSEITLPSGLTAIEDSTFISCTNLTEIVIPEGVVSIGSSAFSDCRELAQVDIPSGVTSIGSSAFSGCEKLVEVDLPAGISEIPGWLFSGCESLVSVSIPKGVTSIGERAFYECKSLTALELPDSVRSIDRAAFWRCTGLAEINIPDGVAVMSLQVFEECESLTEITLPDSVTEIQQDAFSDCTGLTSINIPDGVTYIGCSAFSNCVRLKTITIPDAVTVVDDGAFKGCSRLTKVIFKDDSKVKNSDLEIEPSAFANCIRLTQLTFPGDLTQLDTGAFSNCTALTSVTIPKSVNLIYSIAFENCEALKYVYFEGDLPSIKTNAFSDCAVTLCYPSGNKTWKNFDISKYEGVVKLASYTPSKPLAAPKVSASNVASTGKIKVKWNAVDGAVKYQVYRSTSKNGTYSRLITTTKTSIVNNKVTAGKAYYYYVVAVAEDGSVSEKSSIVARTCDLAQPVVKLGNKASTGKITISWEPVEGATKYQVYRATSKNGTYTRLITTTSTSITNTKTVAGKTYYYKVRAICGNSAATSAFSAVKSRMCDLERPDVSITRSSGKPKVSWDKVDGAVSYKVYRATSKNGTYKLVKTTTSRYYKDTKATAGKTYYYKVIAVCKNTSGNSAYSGVVSIKSK